MKKEDFERLKAICEKEGFWVDDNHSLGLFHIMVKDIWDGVEFVECLESYESQFSIGKIYKIRNGKTINDPYFCLDNDGVANGFRPDMIKRRFKPSTESAYIEQLKKEAHERFGEIKAGDLFDRSALLDFKDTNSIGDCYGFEGFRYYKENDGLDFNGTCIYQQGKWANQAKERVEVEFGWTEKKIALMKTPVALFTNKSTEKSIFDGKTSNEICDIFTFLASQLEKYLNGEIE